MAQISQKKGDSLPEEKFAFPKELAARESEFPLMLGKFYPGIKEIKKIKEYLASERRLDYSMGIFRHYPELDRQ